jgi:hypothetical protein
MKSSTSVIHFETSRDNKTRWVKQAQLEGSGLTDWITTALEQRCRDYNIRGMRQRKERAAGPSAGRAQVWLKIAGMIATQRVNSTGICKALGISRNSFTRHLADMEQVYGLVAEYVRDDTRKPGWYEIRDWGALDEQQVIRRYGQSRAGAS